MHLHKLRTGANMHRFRHSITLWALPLFEDQCMSKMIYKVVKRDGGWASENSGTYSEKFPTREVARKAAKQAAREQAIPGNTTAISFEDDKGHRHNEIADGHD
jgi:hypothetical protein